jgi:hypothetical protein
MSSCFFIHESEITKHCPIYDILDASINQPQSPKQSLVFFEVLFESIGTGASFLT